MDGAFVVQPEKVTVVRDNHTAFRQGKREMLRISSTDQTNVVSRRHVDAAMSEAMSDGVCHTLVKMLPDQYRLHCPQMQG
jgi:hypothetical protein